LDQKGIQQKSTVKLSPLTHDMDLDDMSALLSQMGSTPNVLSKHHRRNRTNSNVRFADTLWESVDDRGVAPTPTQVGTATLTPIPQKALRDWRDQASARRQSLPRELEKGWSAHAFIVDNVHIRVKGDEATQQLRNRTRKL
jgi:hypothetical protein